MQLNLPILDQLADAKNILIAGAGGGFDVFIGLPLYFTLRAFGKTVHLANYSFMELQLANLIGETEELIPNRLAAALGGIKIPVEYYPEGFLAEWFQQERGEKVPVWMFGHSGVAPLIEAYDRLVDHLQPDALILCDGGVDSIMRGDEAQPGTMLEDSITLAAVEHLKIPIKIQACLGFGTEVEEMLCHHHALENIAALAAEGAFLGSCALTPQMEVFQLYESACRYAWEQPNRHKSHISTRIIPAVHGEFGDYHLYDYDKHIPVFVSPLMSLYWFFDADIVIRRNLLIDFIRETQTTTDAFRICGRLMQSFRTRPKRSIPY